VIRRYFWEMADSFERRMQQYNLHIEEVYQFLYDSAEEKKHTPEGTSAVRCRDRMQERQDHEQEQR